MKIAKIFFSFVELLSKNKLVVLILLLALSLRIIGVKPGYSPYHEDEPMSYGSATKIVEQGSIDPGRYDYPSLVPLINVFFYKTVFIPLTDFQFLLSARSISKDAIYKNLVTTLDKTNKPIFWSRYITAFFGTAIVLLVFMIGQKLFDKKVGLISAFLIALSYREILNSHFGLPDIYNAFFLLLSFFWTIKLLEYPNRKNYLLSAVFIGLSVSVKYQFFAAIPFILTHIKISLDKKSTSGFWRGFFNPMFFLSPFIPAAVFLILNPYLIINHQSALHQIESVSLKYGSGTNQLDIFSYSYLFHIGIGQILSIFFIAGMIFGFLKFRFKTLLLLSVIFPFFYILTYYSSGGYYTRNFITITPFLLILSGLFIKQCLSLKSKKLSYLLISIVLALSLKDNVYNSILLDFNYSKPWNYVVVMDWLNANTPSGSKIAVKTPIVKLNNGEKLAYEFDFANSEDELRAEGADYAVMQLDWLSNDSYWWMSRSPQVAVKFWNKPVGILEKSFTAMAIRELSDSTVFSVLKPWQAPESNFVVTKIPTYTSSNEQPMIGFSFTQMDGDNTNQAQLKGIEWKKIDLNSPGVSETSLEQTSEPSNLFKSEPINVSGWNSGFVLKSRTELISQSQTVRDGFTSLSFYKSESDAKSETNRISIRLTRRNSVVNQWEEKTLLGKIPQNATYCVIAIWLNDSNKSNLKLDNLVLYEADVKVNYSGVTVNPMYLNPDYIFPNSQGGL